MTRRRRQGWRLPTVTVRLAVAGFLSITTLPFHTESGTVFAQTNRDGPSKPPPPTSAESPRRLSEPQPLQPVDRALLNPLPVPLAEEPVVGPTPTVPPAGSDTTPLLLSLPTSPSLERMAIQRNSLNQVLYRDRRHQLLLSRGDEALASGDDQSAIEHFQALVDAAHDAFIWADDAAHPRGAQTIVDQRWQSLPAETQATYERLHGDEAQALLTESVERRNDQMLLELLRRFPHTAAGRDAMTRELLRAYDSGYTARAVELSERLAQNSHHWRSLSPALQSVVRRTLDRPTQAQESSSSAKVHGISPPALRPKWTYSFAEGLIAPLAEDVAQGDPRDVRSGPYSLKPAPTTSAELVQQSHTALCTSVHNSMRDWLTEREDRRFPIATANQATVCADILVVRDYCGIRAINLRDGEKLWSYTCMGSLAAIASNNLSEEARGGGSPPLSFQTHFAGHGPRGRIESDGRSVFFIDDDVPTPARLQTDEGRAEASPPLSNRLVALPLHPLTGSPEPVWVQPSETHEETLAGHYILGPPLVVDGRLYVMSECESRVECIAFDAADGRIVWRQPIALTEQPIDCDTGRLRMACSPSYAASTIVCPTELGVIVGVDPLTGVLKWVYDHFDDDQRHAAGRWTAGTQRHFGSSELPSRTLVHDGCIVHLPFRSQFVHCIDAATGTIVWKQPREGGLALTAATNDAVLLIGPRDVSALSLVDGSLLWKTACPEPAGHGLVATDRYLLPIADGRCLSLSLNDGTVQGSRFSKLLHELAVPSDDENTSSETSIQLVSHKVASLAASLSSVRTAGGNLTASGDAIIVTTPTHVDVIPQAKSLLDSLAEQSLTASLPIEDELHAAMLHLLLDNRSAARADLEAILAAPQEIVRASFESHAGSTSVSQRATRLLRELLFAELTDAADPRPILDQLARLPGGEADALRLIVSRIEAEQSLGDPARLIAAIEQLRSLNADVMISPGGDAGFAVKACDDVADQLAVLRVHGSPEIVAALDDYLSRTVVDVARSADVAEYERLVTLFRAFPQIAGLRNDVAEAYLAAGRLQQAELLLLQNRDAVDSSQAGRALRMLAELYTAHQLHHEAAIQLLELADEFRDVDVGGITGGEFVEQVAASHPARQIIRRRRATPSAAYHVQVNEHVCDDACGSVVSCRSMRALEQHDRIRRKFLVNDDSSVTIIDRGIATANRSQSRLSLVNRETGQLQGEIDVPSAYWQLAAAGEGVCGQLLPICGRSAHGLSLLEQRPVWSTLDAGDDPPRDKVKIGPIGHEYCVLQTTRTLSVIHPATGEVRWSRDDVSPCVGLMGNEGTGIIGDDQTLTMFDADQLHYTVFRMRSGRLVRTGCLDVPVADARRHRRAVGSRLVYLASDEAGDRLRIWDSTADQLLLDAPLRDRLFSPIGDCREYAFINRTDELVIVDVATGEARVRLSLDADQLADVGDLNVTADPDHYFFNLVGCIDTDTSETVAAMDEVEIPAMRVEGQLLAVSKSGRLIWSQPVDDAALLTNSRCSLPVLTLVSRIRDPHQRQSARLRIDVLDVRTGQSVARQDDLLRTRIVQADYQLRPHRLTLVGLDSQIEIDFGSSAQEMLIHAEVTPETQTR